MAETVDELTVHYEEGGDVIVKELDKVVLSKGAWCTVLYRYQEKSRSTGEFGADKYVIRRYQKSDGQYRPKSKFVISSAKQAGLIVETLSSWISE